MNQGPSAQSRAMSNINGAKVMLTLFRSKQNTLFGILEQLFFRGIHMLSQRLKMFIYNNE